MAINTNYHFIGSNLGILGYFWKRGNVEKGCVKIKDWGTSVHVALGVEKTSTQSLSTFLLLFGNKKNSKSYISFPSLIIEFFWFAWLWLKFKEKIHTNAIDNTSREEHPHIGGKDPLPSSIPSLILLDGLLLV